MLQLSGDLGRRMKRKRGNKKSKRKRGTEVAGKEASSLVPEENSGAEEFDNDNNDNNDSAIEVDTPSSTGTDHLNLANVNPEVSIDKAAGKSSLGRVKVKLRTSKFIDAQLNSSDALTQSDTDKSSPQMGVEKQSVVSEKIEDSANSLPEKETGVSGTASKKPGSIKIKSTKSLGASNNPTTTAVKPQGGGNRIPQQDSRPNKNELNSALTVRVHFRIFLRLFFVLFIFQLMRRLEKWGLHKWLQEHINERKYVKVYTQ